MKRRTLLKTSLLTITLGLSSFSYANADTHTNTKKSSVLAHQLHKSLTL